MRVLLVLLLSSATAQDLFLPNKKDSLHFAVIGNSGTGGSSRYEVARQMTAYRTRFPHKLVFWAITILKDIHLTIEPGQVAALAGPSGAGKTTLVETRRSASSNCQGTINTNLNRLTAIDWPDHNGQF